MTPDTLTPREREIATLTAQGLQASEIALALGIGRQTVKNYKSTIYLKLGVRNAVELVRALHTHDESAA